MRQNESMNFSGRKHRPRRELHTDHDQPNQDRADPKHPYAADQVHLVAGCGPEPDSQAARLRQIHEGGAEGTQVGNRKLDPFKKPADGPTIF